jgi:hypothetical protein
VFGFQICPKSPFGSSKKPRPDSPQRIDAPSGHQNRFQGINGFIIVREYYVKSEALWLVVHHTAANEICRAIAARYGNAVQRRRAMVVAAIR